MRKRLIDFLDWFVNVEQNDLNFNTSKEYVDDYLKSNNQAPDKMDCDDCKHNEHKGNSQLILKK